MSGLIPIPKAELSAVAFAKSTIEVKSARLATNLEHHLLWQYGLLLQLLMTQKLLWLKWLLLSSNGRLIALKRILSKSLTATAEQI